MSRTVIFTRGNLIIIIENKQQIWTKKIYISNGKANGSLVFLGNKGGMFYLT
jgi:Holliday junction resolvase